jgi:hypothetical protein
MKKLEDVYNEYLNTPKKNSTFVISVLFHENINSVMIYLMNVLYFFKNYKVYILISCNEFIYYFLNKTTLPDNIIVVTHRDNNMPIWGNVNLFDQHVKNYIYLKENNIEYDYFWFSASNDVFIKMIDEHLEQNILKKPLIRNDFTKEYINEFYEDFLNNSTWAWYVRLIQDKHLVNTFMDNNIIVKCNEIEGLVLHTELTTEVFDFYINNIYGKNTSKNYIIEEFFIPSYLMSKYNLDYSTFTIREKWCKYKELQNVRGIELINRIKEDQYKLLYCIKTIDRDINNVTRKYILNLFN